MTGDGGVSRRRLAQGELTALLEASGIRSDLIRTVRPMTGGTFNSVYRIGLADGTGLVLKVAPPADGPSMRYEERIMRTEALYYRLAGGTGTPLPTVLHAGFDQDVIDADFLLMSQCPGEPWPTLAGRLGTTERAGLRAELGRIVAGLHTVTGTGFGYPTGALAPLAPSWRTAFTTMLDTVLDDAGRFGARLPRSPDGIRDVVARSAHVLDEVDTPVLVHFDLWDGNILLQPGDGPARIGGVIDAERAFWGDPVAEFVSLALLGSIEEDAAFLDGYRAAGGRLVFDPPTRTRLRLYQAYLYLIMLVEAVPRGYDAARVRWLERKVAPPLVTVLDELAAPDQLSR